MTGPEPNEQFDRWVEQCREQLHNGGAAKSLAVWLMGEGVDSQLAAAILRAAQSAAPITPPSDTIPELNGVPNFGAADTGPSAEREFDRTAESEPETVGDDTPEFEAAAVSELDLPPEAGPVAEFDPAKDPAHENAAEFEAEPHPEPEPGPETGIELDPAPAMVAPPAPPESAAAAFASAFGKSRKLQTETADPVSSPEIPDTAADALPAEPGPVASETTADLTTPYEPRQEATGQLESVPEESPLHEAAEQLMAAAAEIAPDREPMPAVEAAESVASAPVTPEPEPAPTEHMAMPIPPIPPMPVIPPLPPIQMQPKTPAAPTSLFGKPRPAMEMLTPVPQPIPEEAPSDALVDDTADKLIDDLPPMDDHPSMEGEPAISAEMEPGPVAGLLEEQDVSGESVLNGGAGLPDLETAFGDNEDEAERAAMSAETELDGDAELPDLETAFGGEDEDEDEDDEAAMSAETELDGDAELPDLETAFGGEDEDEDEDEEAAMSAETELDGGAELPDLETAFGGEDEDEDEEAAMSTETELDGDAELPDLETAFGGEDEDEEAAMSAETELDGDAELPDLETAFGGDDEDEIEEEPLEFEDSLADAAARMGESLRDDPPEAPLSAREALSRTGGLVDAPDNDDEPPPASPREALNRTGGIEGAEYDAPPMSAREALSRTGGTEDADKEESPPMSAREALARMEREAEGDDGSDEGDRASKQGSGDDSGSGKRYLDLTQRARPDRPKRPARPTPDPEEESGAPSEEKDLHKAAQELGISFREDEGRGTAADELPDSADAQAAKEMGISFRDDGETGGSSADELADAAAAKAAAELGISFRDEETMSKSKKKGDGSRLRRFVPFIVVMGLASIVLLGLALALPFFMN